MSEPQPRLLLLPPGETIRRLPQVVGGLALFGFGIRLMLHGDLGLGPWDVFHRAVAELVGASVGTIIILTGVIVVLGFIPLREQLGLGTVLNAIVIGVATDLSAPLVPDPEALGGRVALMFLGPVIIALGSGLYLGGGLGPGPRDGIMTGLAKRGIEIWQARTGIEVTVLITGLLLELFVLDVGSLLNSGMGVGTLWFTFGIGPMVQFLLPHFQLKPPC